MNKRVDIFEKEQYDGEWMPENLTEAITWLQGFSASIPKEYRCTARIDIGSRIGYYDSSYAKIKISYERPETDEEIAEVERDKRLYLKQKTEKDLKFLAELKAKYET